MKELLVRNSDVLKSLNFDDFGASFICLQNLVITI